MRGGSAAQAKPGKTSQSGHAGASRRQIPPGGPGVAASHPVAGRTRPRGRPHRTGAEAPPDSASGLIRLLNPGNMASSLMVDSLVRQPLLHGFTTSPSTTTFPLPDGSYTDRKSGV